MAEPILTVEHLVKGYGENTVLDDVSFSVRPGEVVVVVGPSGCGKSTLLRCINALEPTQSGRVRLGNETVAYGGKGLTSLRQRIGMVFQSYELFPHLTVMGNLTLAPGLVAGESRADARRGRTNCSSASAWLTAPTTTRASSPAASASASPSCAPS